MGRKDFGPNPWMYPLPVLIIGTYDEAGNPNAMNAAWGVITKWNEITIGLSMHKTTENLLKTGAFTISMGTEETVNACDYVGIESANKVSNKFEKAGFHATKSKRVNAPLIDELPMTLECKVKSYSNDILVGEIINISADEAILTEGKIDMYKLKPISCDPVSKDYFGMGGTVGKALVSGQIHKNT